MYEYRATVLRVVDADTMDLDVDLGFAIRQKMKVRLFGINAPELSTDAGQDAKLFALDWVEEQTNTGLIVIRTVRDRTEKYGRYLAGIWAVGASLPVVLLPDPLGLEASLNAELVRSGFALPYFP